MTRNAFFVLAMVVLAGCAKQTATVPTTTDAVAYDEVTQASFNTAGAPTVEFSVPDMMCPEGCGVKVKEILSEQPGAKEVLVDFNSKTATVAIDEGKFDSQQAIAALVDHSFNNSALKNATAPSGAPAVPTQPAVAQ
jgi:copper chaperone CopZ